MKILIADDDSVSRQVLVRALAQWGYELIVCCDGEDAWAALQVEEPPPLAILDWMMPGLDGVDICRRVREQQRPDPIYLIMLTARNEKQDLVAALRAGADDYITKPFDYDELRVRVQVGARIVKLQRALAERVKELEHALSQVKLLQGLLPICSYCKKIRDDQNYWRQVEDYITSHSEAQFSHSICPECYETVVKPELEKMKQARRLFHERS